MNNFCELLFEDPQARHLLDVYAERLRPIDELSLTGSLRQIVSRMPCAPAHETLVPLARAIVNSEPEQDRIRDCLRSMGEHIPAGITRQAIEESGKAFLESVAAMKVFYLGRYSTPQQAHAILNALYSAAERTPPDYIELPPILTHFTTINQELFTAYPLAGLVWIYAREYLLGNCDAVQRIYAKFSQALSRSKQSPP